MPKNVVVGSFIVLCIMFILLGNEWVCDIKKYESYSPTQTIEIQNKKVIEEYNKGTPRSRIYEDFPKLTKVEIDDIIYIYEKQGK
jgi:hypothetical protein